MTSIDGRFVLAGRAIFTVSNPKGERYTFRINKKEAEGNWPTTYFASLLTGSDNESDYTYMGILSGDSIRLTKASKYTPESKPVAVLAWALQVVNGKRALPAGYAIHHEGRCGRCGRTLTVPSSIESGIGPDCAQLMGLAA